VAFFLNEPLIAQPLHDLYHNLDEIYDELREFEREYPDWITVDSVGHSAEYGIPILMAKLSDNPNLREPEPSLLFVGQVHAEEVIGIEITLKVIGELLENIDDINYRRRLERIELCFIPTANPEGLEVVHSDDVTFRKNCRDNLGDGRFRFDDRPGWDSSGVDLNRNFGLHWDRGDSLFQRRDEQYAYNYYRGAIPFSEPETQMLRDLAYEYRFFSSIVYHGSRSGNSAELVIAPWYWGGGVKRPPDSDAIDALGAAMAGLLPRQNGGYYRQVNSTQRNGQSQDWIYQAVGTFQYMIEAGAEIQPDSAAMISVVNDNLDAVWYLMDLTLGIDELEDFGILTVLATDAHNGEPLEVTIKVEQVDADIVEPRKTTVETGRFDWLLEEDEYDVIVSKFGYQTQRLLETEIVTGQRTTLETRMAPIDPFPYRFRLLDSVTGDPVAGRILLKDDTGALRYDLDVDGGQIDVSLQPGSYSITILSSDRLPYVGYLDVEEPDILEYELLQSEVSFVEDFDVDREWERGGLNQDWGIIRYDGRTSLTESQVGDYSQGAELWLTLNTNTFLNDDYSSVLEIVHRPYFEPGEDEGIIRGWTGQQGVTFARFSQFPDGWDTLWVNLDRLDEGELTLELIVDSDNSVEEDGWLIDAITIYQADERYVFSVPEDRLQPDDFSISLFPNPFNSMATVNITVPILMNGRLSLHDPLGRQVSLISPRLLTAGNHRYLIDGRELASGSYYLKFQTESLSRMIKLTIVK